MVEHYCKFFRCGRKQCNSVVDVQWINEIPISERITTFHSHIGSNKTHTEITCKCPVCKQHTVLYELIDTAVNQNEIKLAEEMKIKMAIEFPDEQEGEFQPRSFEGMVEEVEKVPNEYGGKVNGDQYVLLVKALGEGKQGWKQQKIFINLPGTATDTSAPPKSALRWYVRKFLELGIKGNTISELLEKNILGCVFLFEDKIVKDEKGRIIGKREKLVPVKLVSMPKDEKK